MGANLIADFSLPSFYDNFSGNDISNKELKEALIDKINKFKNEI